MFQVIDCRYVRGVDCEWTMDLAVEGEYTGWGRGKMDIRRCLRCGSAEYVKFVSESGVVTDIDEMCRRGKLPTVTVETKIGLRRE